MSSSWKTLKIGAGGWLTGMDASPDGVTRVVRTDTYGAYLLNVATSTWSQLVTSTSMPVADRHYGLNYGVYEMRVAPTNSALLYMAYANYLYKSTDTGTNWSKLTGFSTQTMDAGNGVRYNGEKMAVDPANANVVYMGTDVAGMFVTIDGGTNWSAVSGIPVGAYINAIVFDPTGGTTGGRTKNIYAGLSAPVWAASTSYPVGRIVRPTVFADNNKGFTSDGNGNPCVGGAVSCSGSSEPTWPSSGTVGDNGITWTEGVNLGMYKSTDAGVTWTLMTGGPSGDITHATVAADGILYVVQGINVTKSIFKYTAGSWTDVSPGGQYFHSIACDPNNSAQLVAGTDGGGLFTSTNRGVDWIYRYGAVTRIATDVPWLANTLENYMSSGQQAFDPLVANKIWFSEGIGGWTTSVTDYAALTTTWTSISKGVEQLVGNDVLSPIGGAVTLAAWDRPVFGNATLSSYPSNHLVSYAQSIQMCWSLSAPPTNTNYICGIVSWYGTTNQSGCSHDKGVTWTPFAAFPAFTDLGGSGTAIGGHMAASTTSNLVWAPANHNRAYYTKDSGASWAAVSLPGVLNDATFDTGWGGLCFAYFLKCHMVDADRVTPNKFYLYLYGTGATNFGLFTSTDSGDTWSRTYASTIGTGTGSNVKLYAVPGKAGHLFFTAGPQGDGSTAGLLYHSINSGAAWDTILAGSVTAYAFGFGTTKSGKTYPTIYMSGTVSSVQGMWQSDDEGATWTSIGTFPLNSLDAINAVEGDKNADNQAYVAFGGSGWAYYSADATGATTTFYGRLGGGVTLR